MGHPYVQVETANLVTTLRRHLDGMLPRFKQYPGVVGITLNGGMARGYADHLSEIDVTFYLSLQAFDAWQRGAAPIAVGICVLDGQLYDIKFVSYDAEQARVWDAVTLWDASYAEILYNPRGLLRDLFAEKLRDRPDPGIAEGLLMSCWWYFELAGAIWIHRGDVLQGHYMFNQAVTALVQALFAANREYIPHEKWLIHMSRSLEWRPAEWECQLGLAMQTSELTVESLRIRQAAIRALWVEIDARIIAVYYPHLPVHVMQKSTYEQLKLLFDEGSMTVSEWQARTGRNVPNGDPFHPVVKVEDGLITLNRVALSSVGPNDMYAWHYTVLHAVVRGSSQLVKVE